MGFKFLKKSRFAIPTTHDLLHKGEHMFHVSYLGLVALESNYWYGKVALVCCVFAIGSMFVKDKPDTPMEEGGGE